MAHQPALRGSRAHPNGVRALHPFLQSTVLCAGGGTSLPPWKAGHAHIPSCVGVALTQVGTESCLCTDALQPARTAGAERCEALPACTTLFPPRASCEITDAEARIKARKPGPGCQPPTLQHLTVSKNQSCPDYKPHNCFVSRAGLSSQPAAWQMKNTKA